MKPSLTRLVWAPLPTSQPCGSPDRARFFISLPSISPFPVRELLCLLPGFLEAPSQGPGYRHRLGRDLFPGTVALFRGLGKGQSGPFSGLGVGPQPSCKEWRGHWSGTLGPAWGLDTDCLSPWASPLAANRSLL